MNRRTRRRAAAVGLAALVGATSPAWAPPVLGRMSAFRVEGVEVTGNRYLPADSVAARAAVPDSASVWHDPEPWLERLRSHPLVREASVRRSGLDRLEFRIVEVEPVALVPTPTLVPVDAEGTILPLDPARASLDLPILGTRPETENERVTDEETRRLLDLVVRLRETERAFVETASEFTPGPGGSVEVRLVAEGACEKVLLPAADPLDGLRRVEMALGDYRGKAAVEAADARFEGQVVLRLARGEDRR